MKKDPPACSDAGGAGKPDSVPQLLDRSLAKTAFCYVESARPARGASCPRRGKRTRAAPDPAARLLAFAAPAFDHPTCPNRRGFGVTSSSTRVAPGCMETHEAFAIESTASTLRAPSSGACPEVSGQRGECINASASHRIVGTCSRTSFTARARKRGRGHFATGRWKGNSEGAGRMNDFQIALPDPGRREYACPRRGQEGPGRSSAKLDVLTSRRPERSYLDECWTLARRAPIPPRPS